MNRLIILLLLPIFINAQGILAPSSNGNAPTWKGLAPAAFVPRFKPIPPFTPLAVPNILSWYDVTDASNVVTSGGRVANLKDKSGNANHMNLANGGGPLYFSTGGSNNLAYMHVDDGHEIYAGSVSSSQPWTMYIVVKSDSFTNNARIIRLDQSNVVYLNMASQTSGQTVKLSANSGAPNWTNGFHTKWEVLSTVWNNVSTWKLQVNNEPYVIPSYVASPGSIGSGVMTSLGFGPHGNGTTATIDVQELIVYTGAVSNANDSLIRRYLVNKYTPVLNWAALFFGDSITEGANSGDNNALSYPALISSDNGYQYLNYGYTSTVAISRPGSTGVAGHNLEDIYTGPINEKVRWDSVRVFFAYSRNDLNTDATWVTNYEAIIQTYINLGIAKNHIYVLTQPAYALGGSAALSGAFLTTYNNVKTVANTLGVVFVDLINADASTFNSANIDVDGVHLTPAGHRHEATLVETFIQ